MPAAHMEEAVVTEMIVNVRDQDREGDPAPKLVAVLLYSRSVDAKRVYNLGVGMFLCRIAPPAAAKYRAIEVAVAEILRNIAGIGDCLSPFGRQLHL